MPLEKLIWAPHQLHKVGILFRRVMPRKAPCAHGERTNAKRKQVGLLTKKWRLVDDLRAHVVFGATEALEQAVVVWPRALLCEAEIAHFDICIVVKHKVLKL